MAATHHIAAVVAAGLVRSCVPSTFANTIIPCPLNFTVLTALNNGVGPSFFNSTSNMQCQSDYLHRTGFFIPPLNSSESCGKPYNPTSTSLTPPSTFTPPVLPDHLDLPRLPKHHHRAKIRSIDFSFGPFEYASKL
ncbi:putative LRR receptor-like serine/threonine-protein [Sesbania bispinosa]|nr:putative LRR receptor-like serine/threonine-protein [Sesbania bispinosa]